MASSVEAPSLSLQERILSTQLRPAAPAEAVVKPARTREEALKQQFMAMFGRRRAAIEGRDSSDDEDGEEEDDDDDDDDDDGEWGVSDDEEDH